ncbi:hypothetical protein Tco_0231039 [Tanacetum coccineum]
MTIQVSRFEIRKSVFHGIKDMKWELRAEFESALDARSWLGSWIRSSAIMEVKAFCYGGSGMVKTDQIGSSAGRVSSVVVLAVDFEAIRSTLESSNVTS